MDSSVLLLVLVIAALGVVGVLAIVFLSMRSPADVRALTRGWRSLARDAHISFTPPQGNALDTARLHGQHRGREVAAVVRIRTVYAQEGQPIHYYTRVEAALDNHQHCFLRINTKGAYRKTDQYLGQPVRPLGDTAVDKRYDIKCIPHDLAERLIAPGNALHSGLLALQKNRYVEIELEGNVISLDEENIETRSEGLLNQFNLVCAIADAFEREMGR